jgi:hypothetical protein
MVSLRGWLRVELLPVFHISTDLTDFPGIIARSMINTVLILDKFASSRL